MTEIILVRYKLPKLENDCIRSVIDFTDTPYHLRVYDNARYNYNLGWLWNQLIKESDSEYICLLNTDTLVEPEWLSKLLEVFERNKKAGAVGPSTNCARTSQATAGKGVGLSSLNQGEMLGGFCLVFPRKVWEDVGGFPEDFGFYGQESAFLAKMVSLGYEQVHRKDVLVFHYGSASAKEAEKRGELKEEEEREVGRKKYQEYISKL